MSKKPLKTIPLPPPATFSNHALVSWADGVVRLNFGDQQGDVIAPRAALVITAAQAGELRSALEKALAALLPAPVAAPADTIDGTATAAQVMPISAMPALG